MIPTETDDAIARARGTLARVRGEDDVQPRRRRSANGRPVVQKLALIGAANLAILIAAIVVGFILPIGMFGALAAMLAMLIVTCIIAFAPAKGIAAPTYERLREADVRALPAQTERWLDAQRPALPAPARTLVDQIGLRLDTLGAQIAALDAADPAAAEVRKLIGEQLPDFVREYQKVPVALRTVDRNGRTPDTQLLDGLKVIEREIGEMTQQLAQGDLDSLATRGRYLEMRYQGDDGQK